MSNGPKPNRPNPVFLNAWRNRTFSARWRWMKDRAPSLPRLSREATNGVSKPGKVGGVLLRSDRGLDVAVTSGASSGGPPSSGTEMGQVVFVDTTIDSLIVGRPITGPEVGLLFSSSNGLFNFTESVASSKWGLRCRYQFSNSPICFAINNCRDKTDSLLFLSWFLIQTKMTLYC